MLTITILRPVATTFVYHYCFGFLFPSFLGTFSANSHLLILDAANFLAGMVVDFLAVNAVLVVGVVLVVGAVLVVEQLAEEVVEYLADSDTVLFAAMRRRGLGTVVDGQLCHTCTSSRGR